MSPPPLSLSLFLSPSVLWLRHDPSFTPNHYLDLSVRLSYSCLAFNAAELQDGL